MVPSFAFRGYEKKRRTFIVALQVLAIWTAAAVALGSVGFTAFLRGLDDRLVVAGPGVARSQN